MSIIQERINQAHTSSSNPALWAMDSVPQNSSTNKKINPAKVLQKRWIDVNDSQQGLNQIESSISNLNAVASSIHVANSAMWEIETHLDKMKAQLGRIVKNYPPFPPDMEDRVKMLKSFTTLRRQIDQLTMPPNDSGATKIMANPVIIPEAGDWQIQVGGNGIIKTIHSQQVHTGEAGLNVPGLPESATDEQIQEVIVEIDRAKTTLRQRRNSLAADSMRFMQTQSVSHAYQSDIEEFEPDAVSTAAIASKNEEIKQALADETIKSLTQAQSQLLLLLR